MKEMKGISCSGLTRVYGRNQFPPGTKKDDRLDFRSRPFLPIWTSFPRTPLPMLPLASTPQSGPPTHSRPISSCTSLSLELRRKLLIDLRSPAPYIDCMAINGTDRVVLLLLAPSSLPQALCLTHSVNK